MIDNFERCVQVVIHGRGAWAGEGGFVMNRNDPGGATNFGITRATLSRWLGRPATVTEVRNLKEITARAIYLKFYWRPAGCDALPRGVDLMAFDIAVNSGVSRAYKLLAAAGDGQPAQRIEALHKARMGFWKRCKDKAGRLLWPIFGRGWKNRETAVRQAALDLLAGRLS